MSWIVLSIIASADPLQLALERERAGDSVAALAQLESIARGRPEWELPRIEAARVRLKLGDGLELAQQHLEVARSVAPENPRAHHLWGLLMEERGRPDDAIAAHETAVTLRTDYADARFRLAGLYSAKSEWTAAEAHYHAVSRLRPDWTHARLQHAAVLEKMGRIEDSEIELRKLLDESPKAPLLIRKLAEFYERTGRPKLAAKVRGPLEPPRKKMRALKKSRR